MKEVRLRAIFHKYLSTLPVVSLAFALWISAAAPGYGFELEVQNAVWRAGDHPAWASAHLDQSEWRPLSEFRRTPQETFWIRETITLKETRGGNGRGANGYVLTFRGAGAFDVFFDGVLLGGSGKPGAGAQTERPGSTRFFLGLPAALASDGEHVVALRASANTLTSDGEFFVQYRIGKSEAIISEIALSMSALGAAAAAALILLYFFLAGSLSEINRREALAAIAVATGVMIIVAIEALEIAGRVPYPMREPTDHAAMLGAICVFAALPVYLIMRFRLAPMWPWLAGIIAVFILSVPEWPTALFDHDARAFILLCIFGLAICAKAFRSRGRQTIPFTVALSLLLVSIIAAPQSLYIFLVFLSVFLSISFAEFSRRQQLAVKQAEVTAARLEAEMLRRNIQPHFLMNSLTAITEWIETAPVDALRFVEGLADEFRSLSKLSSKQLAPLSEEIDLCRIHLDLMSMRQRRKLSLNCVGLDLNESIPPGIFHTLLENAIVHNRYRDPEIVFELAFANTPKMNSYVLTAPLGEGTNHHKISTGKGLQYVRSRLEESYPGRWRFSSEQEGDFWVSRITIANQ